MRVRTIGHILTAAAAMTLSIGSIAGQSVSKPQSVADNSTAAYKCVDRFGTADWNIFLADLRVTNPDAVKKLYEDAEFRTSQIKNLKELFQFGCQAVKDGLVNDPVVSSELGYIRSQIVATEFEKIAPKTNISGDSEAALKTRAPAFYAIPANEAAFQKFLSTKLELLSRQNGGQKAEVSNAEKAGAKEAFARFSLLESDSRLKAPKIEPGFVGRVGLTVKLQQAQFLAKLLSNAIAEALTVSDDEVAAYIAKHTELTPVGKKVKAEAILAKARAGEDFAKLANENSDDPGNIEPDGTKNGGLYKDVGEGKMLPAFEAAAIALEPGAVSPVLTESEYGYHVIKLEKKSGKLGGTGFTKLTYDVRHILISNGVKDPTSPTGEKPVKEYVRGLLENEKETALMAKISRENPVVMAELPPETQAKPAAVANKPAH